MTESCKERVTVNGLTEEVARGYATRVVLDTQAMAIGGHNSSGVTVSFECNNWKEDGKCIGKCLKAVLRKDGLDVSPMEHCLAEEDNA